MNILGLSAYYHDSAACLLRDGRLVAAAQEERFSRRKHDSGFPKNAAAYCLKDAGLTLAGVDCVAYYEKPLVKFDRILETAVAYAPFGFRSFSMALPVWLKKKLWMRETIREELGGYQGPLRFVEHHEAHAASAFFPSPFKEAAILTMDGVGEWATASWGVGRGNQIDLKAELRFPHSLGMLYSAFTYYTGFKVNSGEYKVMGLAPYGEPRYADLIRRELMDLKEDGSFRLAKKYFNYCAGLTMTSEAFHELFGGPPREPETKLTQRDMDLAASVQAVCEEVMTRMARHVVRETGMRDLCLAGGVALNCVGNGRILREKICDRIWIQPAAGDAGGAVGAAAMVWHGALGKPRDADGVHDAQQGSLLGPAFSDEQIAEFLAERKIPHRRLEPSKVCEETAKLLAQGKVIGWFQGRMEFGPRALGSRSILGDPRDKTMQARMNMKIKFREGFRPFAPSVLRERCHDYFDLEADSPYMLLVARVRPERRIEEPAEIRKAFGLERLNNPRSDLPAVTHIDYSARLQTVSREGSALLYDLLKAFERETGCAVLVNTSFNVRGEPIACTPQDAYACFMRTGIDHLVLGSHMLDKTEQPKSTEDKKWMKEFALD